MGNEHYKPVRKVVRRSTVRVVGYHASQKMCCLVPWESQIERDYFEWLEIDPNVIQFYAQPQTFNFNGLRYTPDALVITHQGDFFAEVKPDKVLECPEDMGRLSDIERELTSIGRYFQLVLERDVRAEHLRTNVVALNRYTRRQLTDDQLALIETTLADQALPIFQVIQEANVTESIVFHCVAQGFLLADLTKEIDLDTVVTFNPRRTADGAR